MDKRLRFAAALAVAWTGARGAPPEVADVTLEQQSGTRKAVVSYHSDAAGIATFQFKTGGVDIAHSEVVRTVTGDINKAVGAGTHTFTWDAGRDFPERVLSNLTVGVTLWAPDNPPTYCAVGLVGETFPVRFYGSSNEVPFGVTDSRWKTDWLLLRKIPSSEGETVTLGSPGIEVGRDGASETQRLVRVTQPFYIGVYQVTQQQWGNVTVSPRIRPSFFNNELDRAERPVEMVSYFEVRENVGNSDNPAIDWPATGHTVAGDSFIGRLRAKTGGVIPFDLPTDAQWEYAGRAGTLGAWNNGTTAVSDIADPNLDLLGRYSRNGGQLQTGPSAWSNPPQDCLATNGTAKVGSYLPNDWGLYDMHGNVLEWCLDWYAASLAAFDGDDPEGPATSSNASRVTHGGAWIFTASYGRSAKRNSNGPSTQVNHIGFRVAAPAAVNVSL